MESTPLTAAHCCYRHRVCFKTRAELKAHYLAAHSKDDLADILAELADSAASLYRPDQQ